MKRRLLFLFILLCVTLLLVSSCGTRTQEKEDDMQVNIPAYTIESVEEEESLTMAMPTIFADGMVLQRNKDIRIYGYSEVEGATLKVTFNEQTKEAVVTKGRFDVCFPPMEASCGLSLKVEQMGENNEVLEFNNVSVGEVWVVSGQSNADYEVQKMEDYREYLLSADNYPNLHLYTTPSTHEAEADLIGKGKWMKLDKAALNAKARVSAHMYVTAVRLAAEFGRDVPVAIVHIARSSSSIITWLDYQSLYSVNMNEAMRAMDYKKFYEKNGFYPRNASESNYFKATVTEKPYAGLGMVCYMTYLAHLEGYITRGVVWYQGESDVSRYGGEYEALFSKLSDIFAKTFGNGEDVPIFVIQLSSYADVKGPYSANLKADQYNIARNNDNVYLISSVDGGSPLNTNDLKYMLVHSTRKSPIGIRCANSILSNVYGIKKAEVMNAPEPVSFEVAGNSLKIVFDSDLCLYYGTEVSGFELCQNSVWYEAVGVIEGNSIILSSEMVTKPDAVRYGFGNYLLEMEDGSIYEVIGYEAMGNYTLLTLSSGETIRAYPDDNTRIRFMVPGNLTNASGEPLFIFCIDF